MKKILSISLLASMIPMFIGCYKSGDPVYYKLENQYYNPNDYNYEKINNRLSEFDVTFLFEFDNTKVYRFYDGGECRYFAVNQSRKTSSMVEDNVYKQQYGKSNHKYIESVSVPTEYIDN